jgi:HEAT repeat protein
LIRSLAFTASRERSRHDLIQMGAAAVPALEQARQDSNNRVREEAAVVLQQIGAARNQPPAG